MDKSTFTNHAKAWDVVEHHEQQRESSVVQAARQRAQAQAYPSSSAAEGSLIATYIAGLAAPSVIEIGTHAIVETAQIVHAMRGTGKLTTVDPSSEGASAVRALCDHIADQTNTTLRVVNADPTVFLPRLNGNDYDLIVVSGTPTNYAAAYQQAPRLLRRGGHLIFMNALAMRGTASKGGLTNPADRSEQATMMRELLTTIEDDERFVYAFTPTGDGLLIASYLG